MLQKIFVIIVNLVGLYFIGTIIYYEVKFQMESKTVDANIKDIGN